MLFSAQAILLLPNCQQYLVTPFVASLRFGIVLLFFIAAKLHFAQILFPLSLSTKKRIALLTGSLLISFTVLYVIQSLWLITILLGTVSIGYLLTVFIDAEKNQNGFQLTLIAATIGSGTFLLFEQDIYFSVGAFFIITAVLGLLEEVRIKQGKESHRLINWIALAWIIWVLALVTYGSPLCMRTIPALLLSATLLTSDLLPFQKLRLQENNHFAKRVFIILAFFEVLQLAFLGYLLSYNNFTFAFLNRLAFFFTMTTSIFLLYSSMIVNYLLYHWMAIPGKLDTQEAPTGFEKAANLFFTASNRIPSLLEWQAKKIKRLSTQLNQERDEAKHVHMLKNLRQELNNQFEDPVSAQLAVNATQEYFNVKLVAVSMYDIEKHALAVLACAGDHIPAGYTQNIEVGIMGRAARSKKPQIVNDTSLDKDYLPLQNSKVHSEIEIPLINHGHLKGMLTVGASRKNAFSASDIRTMESVADELMVAWERSSYNRRLRTLIQSSISLSTAIKPRSAIEKIKLIARDTLEARFVFVTLFDQDGSFTRTASSGYAPQLEKCLTRDLNSNPLLQVALEAKEPFRVRDVRKYQHTPNITIDHTMLRGLIVVPIRLHGVSIGAILAFGKQGGIFFSEKDESLASLLGTQAAAAVESAWLIQELRTTTETSKLLYQLSFGILETDKIEEAAHLIADAAYRLAKASVAGIVLFSLDKKIETALEITEKGINLRKSVPLAFVEQTLTTGETITHSGGEYSTEIYLPIQTSLRKYGVLWVEFQEDNWQASSQVQILQTLANQTAIVLERTLFLLEARQKTQELKAAFEKLEKTYDQTLTALMSALDARDRETEGHSVRVGKTSYLLGKEFDLSKEELRALQRGSLLHDIGKIGISDSILNKSAKLTDEEWQIMRTHPSIGKKIVGDIPFLQDAISVIYSHHERWDGSGYPQGLRGEEIPLSARIFSVADIFDALTSHRSYRTKISDEEALAYLKEQAGILVDAKVVSVFERLLKAGKIKSMD